MSSMPLRLRLWLCGLMLGVAGCAPMHPLGISDAEWQLMSTEQRMAARERQATLAQAEAERRAAEARARAEEAALMQIEREARLDAAGYGERVQCVLSELEVRFASSWRRAEPVALDLLVDDIQAFPLYESSGRSIRRQATAYASFDGQLLALCPTAHGAERPNGDCERVLGTRNDYARGFEQAFHLPGRLRGWLRCELVGMPEAPRKRRYR